MNRRWRPPSALDLSLVLGPLTRGSTDPAARRTRSGDWWLTANTDSGPGTLLLRSVEGSIEGQAWGPGGAELLERMPLLLGADDTPEDFRPDDETVVTVLWRRLGRRWRVPATGLVFQTAVQAVLEQKVTGTESRRSWYRLLRDHGSPAPGPAPQGMFVAPPREVVAAVPSWWWRGAGVDQQRSRTVLELARRRFPGEAADVPRRLAAVPGIGPWTVAEVAFRALGDADAVSVGDYHLADLVGYALTGRPRSSDAELLQLLQPYAGHRYRAVRMIELSGIRKPRFGPRAGIPDHR